MKVLDVDLLQDGLTRNLNGMTRLEKEMTDILQSVEGLVALDDALKGKGGQAIRDFYQSCHVPFLHYFLTFTEDFRTVLEQTSQALTSLEPVDAGHIVEAFLEAEVEDGLTRSANITRELTDEANALMYMVADIVSLPNLDDSCVQESVANAKRKRDATVEALHTFDQTHTNKLVPIESSIQSMKEWLENIDGLFKQGLTDVNFQTDQWSKIASNSAIVLKLTAMGFETGIEAQESLTCERQVETKVESDRTWYQVVGDVLNGIVDGVVKAIADIFEGLFDLLKGLFTDPIGFFGGIATAIMNPVDTFNSVWGAVETAWDRDVINGNAHSRGEFFSYAVVSVVGLKGFDKAGKVGKLGNATAKVDKTIPYNAMQTDKLKDAVKNNVKANMQQKAQQTTDLLKIDFSKEAMNKTIQATQNAQIITKSRNAIEPSNMNAASRKLYDDVVKAPIAKTQNWMKQKEQLLKAPQPNVEPISLGPSTNTTVREGIEVGKDSVMQIVGGKDGIEKTKDTGNGNRLNIEDSTKEISETKPVNSSKPNRWYKEDGINTKDIQEIKSPSEIAKGWQGSELYPGIDEYENIKLKKDDEIYILESDYEVVNNKHSGYATTFETVLESGFDSKKLSEGLQIKPYLDESAEDIADFAEYRSKITKYTVNTDELEVAFGKETLANPQYGHGGKPQFFVKDIESEISKGTLSRGESYDLHNYKISSDDYFNMTTQAKTEYAKMRGGN